MQRAWMTLATQPRLHGRRVAMRSALLLLARVLLLRCGIALDQGPAHSLLVSLWPTAHTSLAEAAETAICFPATTLGRGTAFQLVPSHCLARVRPAAPPTAHASFPE